MTRLSATSASFSPKSAFHLVSWNILSEELTGAVYDSVGKDGATPLFSKTLQKQRVAHILRVLEQTMRVYQRPVYCLQEVNDSRVSSCNLAEQLASFFKEHHYQVIYQGFGTFNRVYPELGVMTAIPLQHFDVVDTYIKQVDVETPNLFIATTVSPKDSRERYTIVNTHFPAKFHTPQYMRRFARQFHDLVDGHHRRHPNLIVCGDFNTQSSDPWFADLQGRWSHLRPTSGDAISTISTQRRDRRCRHNTVFRGLIDHVFYRSSSSPQKFRVRFIKEYPADEAVRDTVLPCEETPSDHFSVVISFVMA